MSTHKPLMRFFHPVLPASELKSKPQRVVIDGLNIVLFRNTKGEASALLDRCPHRFTPLSEGSVKDGRLTCPYHGWNFDGQGVGKQPFDQEQKDACRVKSFQVIEKHSYLWVGSQNAEPMRELDEEGWDFNGAFAMTINAPFHLVLDNFNENEHFPFVHDAFGWDEKGSLQAEFSASENEGKIDALSWGPQRNFRGMSLYGVKPGSYIKNQWTLRFDPVNATYTGSMTDKNKNDISKAYSRVSVFFVPNNENTTTLHSFVYSKALNWLNRKMTPLLKKHFVNLIKKDFELDKEFLNKIAQASQIPYSLKGMATDKFDKSVIMSRRLLKDIYYGYSKNSEREAPRATPPPNAEFRL